MSTLCSRQAAPHAPRIVEIYRIEMASRHFLVLPAGSESDPWRSISLITDSWKKNICFKENAGCPVSYWIFKCVWGFSNNFRCLTWQKVDLIFITDFIFDLQNQVFNKRNLKNEIFKQIPIKQIKLCTLQIGPINSIWSLERNIVHPKEAT